MVRSYTDEKIRAKGRLAEYQGDLLQQHLVVEARGSTC